MIRTFYEIQNSFVGRIDLSYTKGGAALTLTPVFAPISPKDITKGTKVYNYDASMYFTIMDSEAVLLENILTSIIILNQIPQPFNELNELFIFDFDKNNEPRVSMKRFDERGQLITLTVGVGSQPYIAYSYPSANQNFFMKISRIDMNVMIKWLDGLFTWRATILAMGKYEGYKKASEYDNSQQNQPHKQSYKPNYSSYGKTTFQSRQNYSNQNYNQNHNQRQNTKSYSNPHTQYNDPKPPQQHEIPTPPPPPSNVQKTNNYQQNVQKQEPPPKPPTNPFAPPSNIDE